MVRFLNSTSKSPIDLTKIPEMKNLLIIVFACLAGNLAAQQFEGTITYKITMEFSDPRKKTQMEETRKRINDPRNRARYEQIEGKLSDPQARVTMERNPRERKEMDQAMAEIEGGSMFPTGIRISMKNENSLTELQGVFPYSLLLYLKENNQRYVLNRKLKTFSPVSARERRTFKSDSSAVVTRTSEKANILGYECTKFIVEKMKGGQPVTQEVWTTTDIKGFDVSSLQRQNIARIQWNLDKVEGVPLKLTGKNNDGVFTVEAVEIKAQPQPEADFKIPGDFKEVPNRNVR